VRHSHLSNKSQLTPLSSSKESQKAFARFQTGAEQVALYLGAFTDFSSVLLHGTQERTRPLDPTPKQLADM
jgi:hypothetical protein